MLAEKLFMFVWTRETCQSNFDYVDQVNTNRVWKLL